MNKTKQDNSSQLRTGRLGLFQALSPVEAPLPREADSDEKKRLLEHNVDKGSMQTIGLNFTLF